MNRADRQNKAKLFKKIRRVRRMLQLFPDLFVETDDQQLLSEANELDAAASQPDAEFRRLTKEAVQLNRRCDGSLPWFLRASFVETLQAFGIAFMILFVVRLVVIQVYHIPSGSMEPGLLPGDRVIVWKLPYGLTVPFSKVKFGGWKMPERGDVLVFKFPNDPGRDFIKRVIGLPGDTVQVENGVVILNGRELLQELDGKYLDLDSDEASPPILDRLMEKNGDRQYRVLYEVKKKAKLRDMPPTVVPQGKYFFMGDNRDHSHDGRAWGLVDYSLIRGEALVIYLSFAKDQPWKRIGRKVR